MKTIKSAFLLGVALLLSGCAALGHRSGNGLPFPDWHLGFLAPPHMDVWLETATVQDTQDRVFLRAGSGTVAISDYGDPAGWIAHPGGGAGLDLEGMGLPKRIYVRWQSLVEPQTYRTTIEIPESVRQQMLTRVPSELVPGQLAYQDVLTIGLAPGGWVKVWVRAASAAPVEVLCLRGEIEPKGPYQGRYNGAYARLQPQVKEYLQTHPIPYGSWACPSAPLASVGTGP